MSKALKDKKQADIKKELKEAREQLRAFRFGVSGAKTKNVKEGRTLRRHIARLLTELRERDIKADT